jgi:hypothetical protein
MAFEFEGAVVVEPHRLDAGGLIIVFFHRFSFPGRIESCPADNRVTIAEPYRLVNKGPIH